MFQLMNEREAARRLNLSVRSLQRLREAGTGPAFFQISAGRKRPRIAYNEQELTTWLEGRRRLSTSDGGAAEAVHP